MTSQPAPEFFESLRTSLPIRSPERWVGGVCAAWARRWGIDPLIVRGAVVVASFVAGVGLIAYGLAWLFMPEPDSRIHAQEALAGRFDAAQLGGLFLTLTGMFNPGIWYFRTGLGWLTSALAITGVVALIVVIFKNSPAAPGPQGPMNTEPQGPMGAGQDVPMGQAAPPPAPPVSTPAEAPTPAAATSHAAVPTTAAPFAPAPPHTNPQSVHQPKEAAVLLAPDSRITRVTFAAVLLLIAAAIAARYTNIFSIESTGLALEMYLIGGVLIALGLGVFAAALRKRRSGAPAMVGTLVAVFVALPAIGLAGASVGIGTWQWGSGASYGNAMWQPNTAAEAAEGFDRIAIGDVDIALSSDVMAQITEQQLTEEIAISLAIGDLDLQLPADVPIIVEASIGAGEVDAQFPRDSGYATLTQGGIGVKRTINSPAVDSSNADDAVVIVVSNGLGNISIDFED